MAKFDLAQLNLPPGHRAFIDQMPWSEAEALWNAMPKNFEGYGKVYFQEQLEIMAPLRQHTRQQLLLSGFVEDICLNLNLQFSTSSISIVAPDLKLAIEPVWGFCLSHGNNERSRTW